MTHCEYDITPVSPIGYRPDTRSMWQKLKDWVRRREYLADPIYPEGTRSVVLDTAEGRIYIPAAVITEKEAA